MSKITDGQLNNPTGEQYENYGNSTERRNFEK